MTAGYFLAKRATSSWDKEPAYKQTILVTMTMITIIMMIIVVTVTNTNTTLTVTITVVVKIIPTTMPIVVTSSNNNFLT